jgi:hypothetical protein
MIKSHRLAIALVLALGAAVATGVAFASTSSTSPSTSTPAQVCSAKCASAYKACMTGAEQQPNSAAVMRGCATKRQACVAACPKA